MNSYAQDTLNLSPVGEYHLTGVMETASGIRINQDSTFDFYFSYGAIDREGHGKWSYRNNCAQRTYKNSRIAAGYL